MRHDSESDRRLSPTLKAFSFLITFLSFAILIGFIIYLIVSAFSFSFSMGIRSLFASFLPPLAVTYISYFTNVFKGPYRNQVPRINIYVISTFWMILIMAILSLTYDPGNVYYLPITELLFSFTLVIIITFYRAKQYTTSLATSYGIISGFLLFNIFQQFVNT